MPAKGAYNYLNFTRKERRGTLALLFIIILLCSIPFIYPLVASKNITQQENLDSSLVKLQTQQTANNKKEKKYYEEEKRPYDHPSSAFNNHTTEVKGTLFYFDPNTISEDGWKKLGLRDKTIATILNYRNKGGRFKQPDDIKKIWGLFPDEAERLIPYVNIVASNASSSFGKENSAVKNYSNDFSETKKYDNKRTYAPVDVNHSDTSAWIALPGIGSKLSQRIINFREKLGGFYSINQVGETFGLPDSTFQKIKPLLQLEGTVRKINLNTISLDQLKTHPYVRYQLGNAIIQYRTQHGEFKTVGDIRKIMIVTEEIFAKLSPYLAVE